MAVSRTFLASGAQMDIWGYTAAVIEDFVYPPQSPPVADRTKEHVCIKTGAFLDTKLEHFETLNLDDVCRRVFGIPRDLNDVGGSRQFSIAEKNSPRKIAKNAKEKHHAKILLFVLYVLLCGKFSLSCYPI